MARGQMTALLGLLAVAGYQNRDKLREMLGGLSGNQQNSQNSNYEGQQSGGLGGVLGGLTGENSGGGGILGGLTGGSSGGGLGGLAGLGGLLGGGSSGGVLSSGLGGLLEHFQQNGHGQTAQSWVQPGPNAPIDNQQLEQALGPDVLQDLSARTGLSHQELLSRLSRELPRAVDDLTPNGQLPNE